MRPRLAARAARSGPDFAGGRNDPIFPLLGDCPAWGRGLRLGALPLTRCVQGRSHAYPSIHQPGRFGLAVVGFGLFGALAQSAGAAPVVVNHVDPSGGFHSLDAPDPTSTAPGTTIGAQRRVCFEAAANNRAARLESDVAITVDADPGSALEGFVDSEAHLVCYRVRDDKALEQAKFERTDVAANNPFGGFGVRTNRPDRLCVPSTLSVR